jgi:DNA replication protein DnaD
MIQPKGYFKIHRELFSKPIWCNSTLEQQVILMTLVAMANWKESQWEWNGQSFETQPGQFVTSLDSIVKECVNKVTSRNVRTALVRFEKLGFLTSQATNRGRLITLTNWGLYQSEEDRVASKLTSTRQASDKQVTNERSPNEEVKKYKKVRKDIYSAKSLQEIASKFPGKKIKKVRDQKLPKLIDQFGEEQIRRCLDRYATECQGTDRKYILNESTFWNGRYMDYLDENYTPEPVKAIDKDELQKTRVERQAERYREKLKKSREKLKD